MPDQTREPEAVHFHMIKSAQFRAVHADGVWGGATPSGLVHMVFYAERPAIPTELVHPILPSGELGPEDVGLRRSRDGIVRQLEVDVFLSIEVAGALHRWLGEHVEMAKRLRSGGEA